MADHFEETIGLRVTALEARVAAMTGEAESVKQHFVELREFITFTVTTQVTHLKADLKHDLQGVEQRLGARINGLERRLDGHDQRFDAHDRRFDAIDRRLDEHDRRFDRLEQRFDGLDRKVDALHDAMKLILREILDRLPARGA